MYCSLVLAAEERAEAVELMEGFAHKIRRFDRFDRPGEIRFARPKGNFTLYDLLDLQGIRDKLGV